MSVSDPQSQNSIKKLIIIGAIALITILTIGYFIRIYMFPIEPNGDRVQSQAFFDEDAGKSENFDDLQTRLEAPSGAAKKGDTVTVKLYFKNTGAKDMRVYMLDGEHARRGISDIYIKNKETGEEMMDTNFVMVDGYMVTEEDFPLIKPGEEISFEQSVNLDSFGMKNPGQYSMKWSYRNDITKWEGGVQTFMAVTKEVFGGKKIPGIWTGEKTAYADFVVE